METSFSATQLQDGKTREVEKILRTCVHCGFCTATCPTYVLLGDELDSPRGRIYLIKDMLENNRPGTPEVVKHVDRCLSCLSCMTTCPSGVNYMHLIDHARSHIEKTYRRPLRDRLLRNVIAFVLPNRKRFRLALRAARLGQMLRGVLEKVPRTEQLRAMLELAAGQQIEASTDIIPRSFAAVGPRQGRVALLSGCAQPVMAPSINQAATRVLTGHGVEVVLAKGEGCCGALVHHMGKEDAALALARHNIDAWISEMDGDGLDAIVVTTSGCGTTIKDYGYLFREDHRYAKKAQRVSAIAKDITEYLQDIPLKQVNATGRKVAYHSACSLQHGQQVKDLPKRLLSKMGFDVRDVPEGHICCGSAGTYNMLQPELSSRLRERKVSNIRRVKADIVASGNIGCISQIGASAGIPVVHTVELLDWATGGPVPAAIEV